VPPVHGGHVTCKLYDKLVRDRTPEIIRDSGKTCAADTFNSDDFRRAWREKLLAEAQEVAVASDHDLLTEPADISEVVDALLTVHGLTQEDLRMMQDRRSVERGGT